MENSKIAKNVILFGNGINRVGNTYSWSNLVTDLISFIGATSQIKNQEKPFTLLYEEIIADAVGRRGMKEQEIKDFIADKASSLKTNNVFQYLSSQNNCDFMTTNYDFTLENCLNGETEDQGIIKQTVFSLFRHSNNKSKVVWHIHGDASVSSSIMLGYNHYGGYLEKIRRFCLGLNLYKNHNPESISKKFSNNSFKYLSWIDYFFTKDIHIIGFQLDYAEIHLWWLLSFRARKLQELPITNRIFFYVPDWTFKENNNKLQLLTSFGVTIFEITTSENGNYEEFYKNALSRIDAFL